MASQARFRSILFGAAAPALEAEARHAPAYFADLNLDQVVGSVTAGRDEYDLERFFWSPLQSVDAVAYRQEVFRDLEHEELLASVRSFAEGMRETRRRLSLADRVRYGYEKQRWFLDAAGTYCETVARFLVALERLEVRSRGLLGFRAQLAGYLGTAEFGSLEAETAELVERLSDVHYSLRIRGPKVTVRRYDGEADDSREVEETFERFRQGAVKDYRARIPFQTGMDHVEARVLEGVAQLHPDVFAALTRFCERHSAFVDDTVRSFDREVQFYVAYLEHSRRFEAAGLRFCYPVLSADSKEVRARDTFDLALAGTLVGESSAVVSNDFRLEEPERIFVVTGPNQGGKTTFARTFGQLHHLASLGCPVPGREAQLFLFDALFTHFEQEEDIRDLSGKLGADLERVHEILERATPRSVVILNESLSATTLSDAALLGRNVLQDLIELDLLGVFVTFVDELASLSDKVVSMVSTVAPGNPALRTYKVMRRPADGLAYAAVLAEKYGLTYEALKERIAS